MRGIQKHMADAMVRSVTGVPQACVFLTVDVTPTMELVERLRQSRHLEGLRVTPLAVVARAVVHALADHPELNSSWDESARQVVTKHYVNLGIAVAGPHGLVVPNIKDAQDLSLRDLTRALTELTATAREVEVHARRPERRHHHDHQRRRVRGRRRHPHPQPGRGGHPRLRRRAAAPLGARRRRRRCARWPR